VLERIQHQKHLLVLEVLHKRLIERIARLAEPYRARDHGGDELWIMVSPEGDE